MKCSDSVNGYAIELASIIGERRLSYPSVDGEKNCSVYALLYANPTVSLFSLRPASIIEASFADFYTHVANCAKLVCKG